MHYLFGFIVLAINGLIYYFAFYSPQQQNDWENLPTLPEYLSQHPECKTEDSENARCFSCGSDKVMFQPLTCLEDPRYKHFCVSCGKRLFRSKAILS